MCIHKEQRQRERERERVQVSWIDYRDVCMNADTYGLTSDRGVLSLLLEMNDSNICIHCLSSFTN